MGVVVAARHLELGELRAIKYLQPGAREEDDAPARFLREARAASRLRSEHTVRVHDVGRFEGGEPYMVMEHLVGCDLKAELARRGRFSIPDAIDSILQVCEALAEAHAHGIIHRDLKPSNLFLTTSTDGAPCIKVLDFGISKIVGALAAEEGDLTHTAASLGTPAYASPEQMTEARDIDVRTDIWSLGVILYELLSNAKPFEGKGIAALAIAVASRGAAPLREHRPEVPPGLEAVVMQCLRKDREERYPDVESLARSLAPFGSPAAVVLLDRIVRVQQLSNPGSSGPISVPSLSASGSQPRLPISRASWSGDTSGVPDMRPRAPRILAYATVALVIAGLIAAVVMGTRPLDGDPAASPPPPTSEPTPMVELPADTAPATPPATATASATSTTPEPPHGTGARKAPPSSKRDPFGDPWR
jgi:eukaryotic-like serine/threonine-protein kinase